jgi:hypothetical protein
MCQKLSKSLGKWKISALKEVVKPKEALKSFSSTDAGSSKPVRFLIQLTITIKEGER